MVARVDVLSLAAANAAGAVLFGALYAVAGARLLSQSAFLAGLGLLFVLATALWVRIEARHVQLDVLGRAGRAAAGLAIVVVALPVAVLGPLFWLDERLPPEAGLHALRGGILALVLITLVLVVLVNLAGVAVALLRGIVARRGAVS